MANNFKSGRLLLGTEFEGYKYGFFETGTSTPKTTYKDSNLTVGNENTHPVVLDANGAAQIWFANDADATFYTPVDAVVYTDQSTIGYDIASVLASLTSSILNNTISRNAIINGDFNIWQRGTSFAAIATNIYSADRWVYNKSGVAVHTVSRSTDIPTVAQAGRLYNYSILIDCTTVDSSIAASDYVVIEQRLEGYNWLPLAQRTITLSFWVKATKTGTYCVSLKNSGQDRSYIAEYTVSTTATWEYKTVFITASPPAGTWDYATGIGVYVTFVLSCGSTFQITPNSWQTGNYLSTSNQVNATDNTSNDFRLCGVQLEPGGSATIFEQISIHQELSICQRYFEKSYEVNVDPSSASGVGEMFSYLGSALGNAQGLTYFNFKVIKRTIPTITWYSPVTGTAARARVDGTTDFAVTTHNITSSKIGSLLNSSGGSVGGANSQYEYHWTANAEL